jgi:hypothetical protein
MFVSRQERFNQPQLQLVSDRPFMTWVSVGNIPLWLAEQSTGLDGVKRWAGLTFHGFLLS